MKTQATNRNPLPHAVLGLIAASALVAEVALQPAALADDSKDLQRHAVASQTSWTGFAVLAALFTGMGMASNPGVNEGNLHHPLIGTPKPPVMRSSGIYQVPDVTLMDSSGKEIPLRTSLDTDGPVMLNFISSTCSAQCPTLTAAFSQVQARLDPQVEPVRMVSISIDPEHDTPAKLKEYARKYNVGPQWQMLTGRLEDSIAVQRAFNAYRSDKTNHEPVTFLRAGRDKPWVRLDGLPSVGDLMKEYRRLMASK